MGLFNSKQKKPRFWTMIEQNNYCGYNAITLAKDVPGGMLMMVIGCGGRGGVPTFIPGVSIKDLQGGTYGGDWNNGL